MQKHPNIPKHNDIRGIEMSEKILTQEALKNILHYEPDTGIFTWKENKGARAKIGNRAGGIDCGTRSGYRRVKVNGCIYLEHRLIFLYINGMFPINQVDHINHVRDDNRWINLRLATNTENSKNNKQRVDNTSGSVGVIWHKGINKWNAVISIDGIRENLGFFKEKNHAMIARWMAEDKHNYHVNHGK